MQNKKNKVKYPDNLDLKLSIVKSGRSVTELADTIGVSRKTLSDTVNGHYKGANIIPLLQNELSNPNYSF